MYVKLALHDMGIDDKTRKKQLWSYPLGGRYVYHSNARKLIDDFVEIKMKSNDFINLLCFVYLTDGHLVSFLAK